MINCFIWITSRNWSVMCSNSELDLTVEEHRLQTFHGSDFYKRFKLLAQNGFFFDGETSASCQSCRVSVDFTHQVNSDVVNTHQEGCKFKKRSGQCSTNAVPAGANPEELTHERNITPVQEEEASLRHHERVFSNGELNTINRDGNPVVDLRDQEVHLATEVHNSRNTSDGTAEAPVAVGPVQVLGHNRERQAVDNHAGVPPEELYGTSQLCLSSSLSP